MRIRFNIPFILLFYLAKSLFAEPFHYQNVLVGERAAGMAGAFTAVADDSSACFYNPAGLAQITMSTFSVSANAGEISSYTIRGLIPGGEDLTLNTVTFYPVSWSGILKLGRHRLGFSVIVKDNTDHKVNLNKTIEGYINDIYVTYDVVYNYKLNAREYLIGPSWAYPVKDFFSLGISLFVFYKTAGSSQFFYFYEPNSQYYSGNAINEDVTGLGLLWHLGTLFKLSKKWYLGLNLRSGGVLSDVKELSGVEYSGSPDSAENEVFPTTAQEGKYGEPPGFTLGIAYKGVKWRVGMDYTHIVGSDILRPVNNFNIGAERLTWRNIPIRFGFYTNNTSLPAMNNFPDDPQADWINFLGLAFGLGYLTEHTSTSLTFIIKAGCGKHKEIFNNEVRFYDIDAGGLVVNLGGSYWF